MQELKSFYLMLIMISSFFSQQWSEPVKLPPPINVTARSNYPFISRDGKRLYFSSFRCGGGTEDIYFCDKIGDGWGEVIHLNKNINTAEREVSSSVTSDGKQLYFCRYTSRAGWDIFYSTWDDTGWGKAMNVGPPVNTPGTEFTACISAGGDTLVFEGPHYWETMYPPDLMYSIKTDTGWSYPKLFFTNYDGNRSWERDPWISADGKTLFFQTAYHKDWERDIFFSKKEAFYECKMLLNSVVFVNFDCRGSSCGPGRMPNRFCQCRSFSAQNRPGQCSCRFCLWSRCCQ